MKIKITLLLTTSLFLRTFAGFAAIFAKAEFSYYKLALQWPNSICNQGNQCVKNTFSIHGLWPFWADHSIVQPCPGLELTSSQICIFLGMTCR
ncbi:hypothetical protein I3843_15G095700 [Carya illinoinensis]|nr:hypothetical protein I3843_15G095700 [Carya illinoinensis]